MMWNMFAKEDGFPYQVQEQGRKLDFSFSSLHDGTHKSRGGNYSVFKTIINNPERSQYSYLNLQRLKTLRHPNVLTYIHHYEEEPHFEYVVTGNVTPLLDYLDNMKDIGIKNDYIAWGILKILKALIFCHEKAKLLHNNVGSNSVFVDKAGEWQLAEFGISNESYCGPMSGTRAEQYHKWIKTNSKVTWELDTYGIAVLVQEAYEGRIHAEQSVPDPSDKIPESFKTAIKFIFNGEKIPTLQQFLSEETAANGFRNDFIEKLTFLEEIHQISLEERSKFYDNFHSYLKYLPDNLKKFKVFPLIMLSYDYGCEGSELLPSVMEFCQTNDPEVDLVPMIERLFNSPNRKTRKALLENMSKYITVLAPSVVSETIYPMWEVGFEDTCEIIRLETLKSTEHLVQMLDHQRISRKLLPKLVGRMVQEKSGEMREIALKTVLEIIGNYVEMKEKKQLLLSVITKVLKDTHSPIKSAAINSMVKLQDNFTHHDVATKLLPQLCLLTIDSNTEVKERAISAMRALLVKIEKSAKENMPEPSLKTTISTPISWTEWAKDKISSRIFLSGIFQDEYPKHASIINSTTCKSEINYTPLASADTPKEGDAAKRKITTKLITEECEDDSKFVYLNQNQDCEDISEEDKPNEQTNNNKEEWEKGNNKTQRSGKKLNKGPRKLGTRINQRK